MGGLRYITGDPTGRRRGSAFRSATSSRRRFAALGTMVALRQRDRTGRGQVVDVLAVRVGAGDDGVHRPGLEIGGYQRERTGSITPNVAPSNIYPTADGAILIGANRDTIFRRLTKAMGQPELATDPRYATHVARGNINKNSTSESPCGP